MIAFRSSVQRGIKRPASLTSRRWMFLAGMCLLVVAGCGGDGQPESRAGEAIAASTIVVPPATATFENRIDVQPVAEPTPTLALPSDALRGRLIALDAGHNPLTDEGAVGLCRDTEVTEAEMNLAVRDLAREHLESAGATIFYVPQIADRASRVAAAESAGADILISIHHNSFDDPSLNHTVTFVSDSDDIALASHIHPAIVAALATDDSGIQIEEFGMTVHGTIPAVLTEATFVTNPIEACNFLGNRSRIAAEAWAIALGVVGYFAEIDESVESQG